MKQVLSILLLAFLISSCSSGDSKKFVGRWRNLHSKEEIMIEQFGENFLVQKGEGNNEFGTKMTASYNKDLDKLVVNYNGNSQDILYNPQTKHILFFGEEFADFNQFPVDYNDLKNNSGNIDNSTQERQGAKEVEVNGTKFLVYPNGDTALAPN